MPPSLPDTDFARIAPLPLDEKRRQLEKLKGGFTEWSYRPVRMAIPDIFSAGGTLFPSTSDTPWPIIRREIIKMAKRHIVGEPSNLEVAALLYEDLRYRKVEATQQSFGPFLIAPGFGLKYWTDMFIVEDSQILLPVCDFRRSNGFNLTAQRFAASITHFHIFDRYPEFRDAKLQLIKFPPLSKGPYEGRVPRRITRGTLDPPELFDFEHLEKMVFETRTIWAELHEERVHRARRGGRA
jgi:hypothetical protein